MALSIFRRSGHRFGAENAIKPKISIFRRSGHRFGAENAITSLKNVLASCFRHVFHGEPRNTSAQHAVEGEAMFVFD
ncbi:MAG TPA: hypothetical protein P5114_02650 [Hyphomicrobiaceae bacterium]|nr:hypothetical protein [Hyphomicrobiaceae bacterium]